jgi:hypothetical protein
MPPDHESPGWLLCDGFLEISLERLAVGKIHGQQPLEGR